MKSLPYGSRDLYFIWSNIFSFCYFRVADLCLFQAKTVLACIMKSDMPVVIVIVIEKQFCGKDWSKGWRTRRFFKYSFGDFQWWWLVSSSPQIILISLVRINRGLQYGDMNRKKEKGQRLQKDFFPLRGSSYKVSNLKLSPRSELSSIILSYECPSIFCWAMRFT